MGDGQELFADQLGDPLLFRHVADAAVGEVLRSQWETYVMFDQWCDAIGEAETGK